MKKTQGGNKLPLSEETSMFLASLAGEQRCSAATISAYRSDVTVFRQFFADHSFKTIEDVCTEDIERYIAYLFRQHHISSRSAARKISSIKAFFRFLHSERICSSDPARKIENLSYQKTPPHTFNPEDINALFAEAVKHQDPSGLAFHAMLELLYSSGLRISEVVEMRLSAFTFSDKDTCVPDPYIIVRGKGARERMLPLIPTAQSAIECHLRATDLRSKRVKDPYVFESSRSSKGHITRQAVGKMLKKTAVSAGIPPELVHPHALRHAFATHLLSNNVAVETIKDLLGHADISTTQIYTDVCVDQQQALLNKHPIHREPSQ